MSEDSNHKFALIPGIFSNLLFQSPSSRSDRLNLLAKLLSTLGLLYVAIGVRYVDPEWWRTFFFTVGSSTPPSGNQVSNTSVTTL